MSEKERLIELLREAEAKCANTGQCRLCEQYGKGGDCQRELIADYLLANGVIVPPCKVGDTVYSLAKDINSQIFEGVVYEITQRREESYFRFTRVGYYGGACSFEDFGKTVFLSRELAEKALAERRATDAKAD